MAQTFSAQVTKIVRRNSALLSMVAQESTQRLIQEANLSKAKGGKMPLDTGFLRASGRVSYTGMPTGPVRPPAGERKTYRAPVRVILRGFKLGSTIYYGWTAIYARRQNLYNSFLDSAVANWQNIVNGVVVELRNRMR